MSSLQNGFPGRGGAVAGQSPGRTLAQHAAQAHATQPAASGQHKIQLRAHRSPNPAALSSSQLLLPPSSQAGPTQSSTSVRAANGVPLAPTQNPPSSSTKIVRIRKAHISPNPNDNIQKLALQSQQSVRNDKEASLKMANILQSKQTKSTYLDV